MDRAIAHRAARVHPVHKPAIDDGCVLAVGDRIAEVGRWTETRAGLPSGAEVIDHGEVALVPGFVNAHAHLELTLHGSIPADEGLFPWLDVVAERSRRLHGEEGVAGFARAADEGARLLAESGAAAVADTSLWGVRAEAELLTLVCREFLAFAEDGADRPFFASACAGLEEDVRQGLPSALQPHALYTVHPSVVRLSGERARALRRPLAIHLAETVDEVELFASGGGPLRDFLERHGADAEAFLEGAGTTPWRRLESLGCARGAVCFHGNYLGREDWPRLALHGASVVYCPRSHRHFGHTPHPAGAMLRAGVNVGLGTDGLVSNEGLDMAGEVVCALERCPDLSPDDALMMATLAGARAFGLDGEVGSLAPGLRARVARLPLDLW